MIYLSRLSRQKLWPIRVQQLNSFQKSWFASRNEFDIKKDYYKDLGVEQGASQAEIKKEYFKLAMKYHPDKATTKTSGTRFKEVAEAYETLGDEKQRKRYDDARTFSQADYASSFN